MGCRLWGRTEWDTTEVTAVAAAGVCVCVCYSMMVTLARGQQSDRRLVGLLLSRSWLFSVVVVLGACYIFSFMKYSSK